MELKLELLVPLLCVLLFTKSDIRDDIFLQCPARSTIVVNTLKLEWPRDFLLVE